MDIVVVGTGYVGIVTGTCLAESGNRVICVDIDEEKIAIMEKGKVPIYEPHLESLLVKRAWERIHLIVKTKFLEFEVLERMSLLQIFV